jgi:RNA polymerase sigma-70 factor, ECF subfamily
LREPDQRGDPAAHPSEQSHGDPRAAEDRQLADACRTGEISAFEQLYNTHGARLKSVALNLLGNVTDAEDAVQEAFLKAYRNLHGFRGQSSFSTWVYRILLNCCYDVRRRKVRRPEQELADSQPEATEKKAREESSVAPVDHPLRLALESCVAKLSVRQREVFVLFEVEGFKHAEIATMLKISETNSKNILCEAKRSLRRQLQTNSGL